MHELLVEVEKSWAFLPVRGSAWQRSSCSEESEARARESRTRRLAGALKPPENCHAQNVTSPIRFALTRGKIVSLNGGKAWPIGRAFFWRTVVNLRSLGKQRAQQGRDEDEAAFEKRLRTIAPRRRDASSKCAKLKRTK